MGLKSVHLLLPLLLFLGGCVTVAEKEALEALPMYGQPEITRSDYLKGEDAAFIKQVSYRYRGDMRRASRDWSKRAVNILRLGDADSSMRDFNRAWLLDPNNYQVYWGFAQVLVLRNRLAEAAHYIEKAQALIDEPYQKPALLVDSGTLFSLQGEQKGNPDSAERSALFAKANAQFSAAASLDESYLPVWQRWAQSLYRQGDYAAAWDKVRQARLHGDKHLSHRFLQELSAKLPEPSL